MARETRQKMRMFFRVVSVVLLSACVSDTNALSAGSSDEGIKAAIVRESIGNYPGSCPCPENIDRAGRRCGKRSAYSRAGGASPLCYPGDVTDGMIEEYKARNRREK